MITELDYANAKAEIVKVLPEHAELFHVEGKVFFPVICATGNISSRVFLVWFYRATWQDINEYATMKGFPLQEGITRNGRGTVMGTLLLSLDEILDCDATIGFVERQVAFARRERWIVD